MECTVTGQPMTECEHCLDPNYIEAVEPGPDFETIGPMFRAQFRSVCVIEPRHEIRKGDKVNYVRRADNPNILVKGVACKNCRVLLPRGKQ